MFLANAVKALKEKIAPSKPKETPQTPPVYQGRWGWHPLPYESFIKLKHLHKWAFEAYKKHCQLYKWTNKTVNRSEEMPETDPLFTVFAGTSESREQFYQSTGYPFFFGTMVHYQKNKKGQREKIEVFKSNAYCEPKFGIAIYIEHIIDAYNSCRFPKENQKDVQKTPLNIEEIDKLYGMIIQS